MNRITPPATLRLSYAQLRTLLTCPHQFWLRFEQGAPATISPTSWLHHQLTEILRLVYRDGWTLPDARESILAFMYPPAVRADLDTLRTQPRSSAARTRVDTWATAQLPLVRWGERSHLAQTYRRLLAVLDDPALLVPSPLLVEGIPLGDLPALPPLTFAGSRIALDQPPFVVFQRDDRLYAAAYRCAAPTRADELRYDMELALFHAQLELASVGPSPITVGSIYVPSTDAPITSVFVQQDVLRQRQRLRVMLARAEHVLDAGDFPAVRGLHDGFPSPCLGCGVTQVCVL